MTEPHQLEYFLLRYVPDVVKGEFVNIGVIAFANDVQGHRLAHVRITREWRRARGLDPFLDTELFEALENELQEWLSSNVVDCSRGGSELSRSEWVLHTLQDCGSNALQLSGRQMTTVANLGIRDLEAVTRQLLKDYCDLPASMTGKEASGRTFIRMRMKQEFQKAGVWPLMRKDIPVSQYAVKGDPLKIDCGYTMNRMADGVEGFAPGTDSLVQLFHAVSLMKNVDSAKVLGYTWQPLREGLRRAERITATLTAVVEDDVDRNDDTVNYAMEMMQESGIILRNVAHLPEIADQARRDLKL